MGSITGEFDRNYRVLINYSDEIKDIKTGGFSKPIDDKITKLGALITKCITDCDAIRKTKLSDKDKMREYEVFCKQVMPEVEKEVAQVKELCFNEMNSLLERGEKLEHIVEQSEEQSKLSKEFLKRTKKKEDGCSIL